MSVSRKGHGSAVKQGGTADNFYSSLAETVFLSGAFLFFRETLKKSSAAAGGSFAPTYQFEKWEIHKVFLHFPNFNL